jgi:hypothetical protein
MRLRYGSRRDDQELTIPFDLLVQSLIVIVNHNRGGQVR